MSWYREQLEDWLKTRDVQANIVFDIGGKQGEVKNRVKSWDVNKYEVLDLPEFDIEKKTLGGSRVSHIATRVNKADIIFCLEVFEYLIDPLAALANIKYMLKPAGKAYITFAFVYPHHNELDMDSIRFTETGIRRMAKRIGISLTQIWYREDKSGLLQSFYSADGMHPSKEYPHHNVAGFIAEFIK